MPLERISSIFDVQTLEAEKAKVAILLNEVKAGIIDINNQRVTVKNSSLSEFQKATTELNASIANTTAVTKQAVLANKEQQAQYKQTQNDLAELKKRNLELTIQAKEKLAIDKQAAQAAREKGAADKQAAAEAVAAGHERLAILRQEAEATEKVEEELRKRDAAEAAYNPSGNFNAGSIGSVSANTTSLPLTVDQGNILLVKQYESEIVKLTATQNEAKAAFKAGSITNAEYQTTIVQSQEKINGYKKSVSDLSKEITLQNNVQATERNSLARAQALLAQYTNAKKNLNVATADGKLLNENYNKAIINTNKFILANADAETVRTKTVGKYGEAITGVLGKAFGFLKTLANIIPGVGIGGIFLAGYEAAKALVGGIENVIGKQKILNDVYQEAGKNAAGDISKITIFKEKLTDLNVSQTDRIKYAKEYNEIADNGNKINLQEINNISLINEQIIKQISLIEKRAVAKAAESKLDEQAGKVVEAQLQVSQLEQFKNARSLTKDELNKAQQEDDKQQQGAFQTNKKNNSDNLIQKSNYINTVRKLNSDALDGQKRYNAAALKLNEEQKELDRQAALLSPLITPEGLSTKDKKTTTVKQSTKDIFDAEFEDNKRRLQRQIQNDEAILSNEKNFYGDRLNALQKFTQDSSELAIIEAEKESAALQQKRAELLANEKVAKGTELNNIESELKDNAQRQLDIQSKLSNSLLLISKDSSTKLLKVKEDEKNKVARLNKETADEINSAVTSDAETRRAQLDKDYYESSQAFDKRAELGLISEKDYNKKRLQLDISYAADKLELEIEITRFAIELAKARGEDVSKQEAKLAQLEAELQALRLKRIKGINDEIKKSFLDMLTTVKQIGEDLFNLLGGIINAQTTAIKNSLKEQQDAAEKKAARDIEIENASADTAEVKAAKMLVINARLQAQKDEFDRKNKAADAEKARVDKAQSIFEITITTAIAVTKALANGGPLAIFNAIAVGALGAAQLAIAIATPIPKYKHGRGIGKEELAITGDGGVSEYVVRGDGSIEKTPAVETLTHLMPKDRVLPNKAALMRELAMGMLPGTLYTASNGIDKSDIKALGDRIDDAVSNIHIHTQLNTKSGWRHTNKRLADYDSWVRRAIKQ